MLYVQVKDGEGVEKAIKKIKKKFEKTGILRELRKRQVFTKPSVARREVIKRARHRQRLKQEEQ